MNKVYISKFWFYNVLFRIMIFIFAMISLAAMPIHAVDYTPKDHVVMLTATVQHNPPQITLNWPNNTTNTGNYRIIKRLKGNTNWTYMGEIPAGSVSYVDTTATVGQAYEYSVSMMGGTQGAGFIYAGIDIPAIENRGKVVLIVDRTYASQLNYEITRLEQDLVGDGWDVIRHDVLRNDTPANIKALIKADYDVDPANVKSVFLLGHIPIYQSANMAPDGHEARPWPADAYYGDMDGDWTTAPTRLPSDVELEVGRVDLSDLPAFAPLGEKELLQRYLDKNHNYRHGLVNMRKRGFIHDDFGEFYGEAFSRSGWGNFAQLCEGQASVQRGNWKNTLTNTDYLWSYICGSGNYNSISNTALTTNDLVNTSYKTTFTLMFGSYLGQWDTQNNLLRSFLAMPEYGLTSAWAGRPAWYVHHMGLGETIGFSAKTSQNNLGYPFGIGFTRMVHVALMGDPTLRMYPVPPPENVHVQQNVAQKNEISWESFDENVIGYYVYRANSPSEPYVRISPDLVTSKSFVDNDNSTSVCRYMVRAVTLEKSSSGTFFNTSQGIVASSNPIHVFSTSYIPESKKIRIQGTFLTEEEQQVSVQVRDPNGVLVYINQMTSVNNGDFEVYCPLEEVYNGSYQVSVGHMGLFVPVQNSMNITLADTINVDTIYFSDAVGGQPQSLVANTELIANAIVSNEQPSPQDVKFIIGLYNADNVLKKISISNLTLQPGTGSIQTGISLPENVDGCYVKVLLWDNFTNIHNLCKMVVFPENR